MPAKIHQELNTKRLESIIKKMPGRTEDNNRAIAFRVEAGAKVKAPFDLGALANSIYVVCGGQDGFAVAEAKAMARNPDAVLTPLPTPKGHDAHVGPSVEYAIHQEFGTRKMAAHPFLVPALREVENQLAEQWENIGDG